MTSLHCRVLDLLEAFQVAIPTTSMWATFPPSSGHTYLLTVVDRFTRWPEAIPLSNMTTIACTQALVTNPFWCPYGHVIRQRVSQLSGSISQLLGTKLHHTTAYHPQSNGLVASHEICPAGPFSRTQLDGWVTVGTFRNLDCTQGGLGLFFSRTCLWSPTHCSWGLQWTPVSSYSVYVNRCVHWPPFPTRHHTSFCASRASAGQVCVRSIKILATCIYTKLIVAYHAITSVQGQERHFWFIVIIMLSDLPTV